MLMCINYLKFGMHDIVIIGMHDIVIILHDSLIELKKKINIWKKLLKE